MKNYGIKVVPLAVGEDVILDELRKMATNPQEVQYVAFSELGRRPDLVQTIQQSLCPVDGEY